MYVQNLTLSHLNVRSLLPSFAAFRDLLLNKNYDVCCLSETWLDYNITNDHVRIPGYSLVRRDRGTRGGGVAIYIREYLHFKVIEGSFNTEQLWLQIKLRNFTLAVGVAYRPPSFNYQLFINELEDALSSVVPEVDAVALLGDFNIDLTTFESPSATMLIDTLNAFNMIQIIESPTRITATSSTLIDLIFLSDLNMILDRGCWPIHGLSDHELVYSTISVGYERVEGCHRTFRSLRNFHYDSFEYDLHRIPFFLIYDFHNIDEKTAFLTDNLLGLMNFHMPLITSRCSKKPAPWLTDTIRTMQRLRDNALKAFKRSNCVAKWDFYKSLRNMTTAAIKSEKRSYFEYRIKQMGSSKNLWRFFRSMGLCQEKRQSLPDHLRDPDIINNYFINAIPESRIDISTFDLFSSTKLNNRKFHFTPVDEDTVYRIIFSIKSPACGLDGLNINFIQLCTPHIVPFIVNIINFCFETGHFPVCWKQSLVIPLPKKSNPEGCGDLRPISILPVLSKIAETVIEAQLKTYVLKSNILPPVQSGFRKGFSCATALLHITDDIVREYDKGNLTLLCLLDFTKAFDTVNHQLLLAILSHIGLEPPAVHLIYSYLVGRSQCVVVGDRRSAPALTNSGVPQGSVLGPLLFSIYTFALTRSSRYCKCHQYADDTQLYYSFPMSAVGEACDRLNADIRHLSSLSKNMSLHLNPSKSELILFGPRKIRNDESFREKINIYVDDQRIALKNCVKSLGVSLDSDLKFDKHVNDLVRRSYASLKLIYTNRYMLNLKTKQRLCESLVLSNANYCDVLYNPFISSACARKLQKLQNSCIRLIFGIRRRDHVSHKLTELQWLNMRGRRLLHSATLFHNILISEKPPYLFQKVKCRTDVHNLNIRFKGTLTPPCHTLEFFKNCFTYQITHIYNNIPAHCKLARTSVLFRKRLFQHIFDEQM